MGTTKAIYMQRYNLGYRSNKELSEEERKENVSKKNKNILEWYHKNKEKIALQRKERHRKNPLPRLFNCAKNRAKASGIPFTIVLSDIPDMLEVCPITQEKWGFDSPRKGVASYEAPSLDRIDNSKGYIPGNIRVISYKANHWKNNMRIEHVERLLKYMKGEI